MSDINDMNSPDEKPEIDYANLPYMSREGVQAEGNFKFLTRSLFLESAPDDKQHLSIWCLSEHEIWVPTEERWLPSAWMAYINAKSEYDALMKICGNIRQWEALKKCHWFAPYYEQWTEEQSCIQRDMVKTALIEGVESGGSGYTAAAKQVLQMIDGKQSGRPKKKKEDDSQHKASKVQNDSERVAHLFGEDS